jgi:alcohol dehydrogenase (cytochrome c)
MNKTRFVLLTLLVLLVVSTVSFPQSVWEPITEVRLRHPKAGDWLSYRRTDDAFAFSPLKEINRSNVKNLRPVWTYPVQDDSRWVPTPIVANGIMYVAEGKGRVLALDVASGDVKWIYTRTYPADIRASQAYLRHRGVSILEDKIYFGTADSYLVALDARTGKLL